MVITPLRRRILDRMGELKLNEAQVADLAGIPRSTMNGIMGKGNSQNSIGHETLWRLSKALQTTMEYLAVGGAAGPVVDNLKFLVSADEHELLRAYRACKPKERRRIHDFIAGLATGRPPGYPPGRAKDRRDNTKAATG